MKKIIILLVFLLVVASVYAFDLPSIKPKIPSFDIPTTSPYKAYSPTTTPMTIKICDQSAIKCQNNVLMFCDNNSWKTRKTCSFDETCDERNGCVKKQTILPNLNIIKPVPELRIVEDAPLVAQPSIAQVCRDGDVKCSSRKTNSVMICQDNQWSVQQKCASNEECITGQGCVSKITNIKLPDISIKRPEIISYQCSVGDKKCSSDKNEVLICSGSKWGREQLCGETYVCEKNRCVPKIVQTRRDTCEETENGVQGMFNDRSYNYDDSCQDNLLFTYSCGNDERYRMEQTDCGNDGCSNGACNIDTCGETENGVRGIFRGRPYNYDASCQGNLLFTYSCGNDGRYRMEQTDCGNKGCSNGTCNTDTCEETENGVGGIFRGRSYSYDSTCQDNSWFTYSCGNEGHYLMEQERCDENEFCDNKKGCVLTQQSPASVGIKKIAPKTTISVQELEEKIKNLEANLNNAGDDQQLAQVDLQNALQKSQQLLQTLSSISKAMHDTTMAIARNLGGSTSEEPQEKTTSSKKKLSKEELNKVVKDVEAQQETLRDKRQMTLTYFQNVDQKMNQVYNMISSALKAMGEMRGLGTDIRNSALTGEEKKKKEENVKNDLKRISELKNEVNDLMLQVTKEAMNAQKEDKEYYLKKLEEYNTRGEELADYLGDLVDQSTALSNYGSDEQGINEKTEQNIKQMDFDGLIQFVLRESYLDNQQDLEVYAEKVKYFNDQKKQIREELSRTRKALTKENVENLLSKDKKLKDELVDAAKKYRDLINPKKELDVTKLKNLEPNNRCSEFEPVTVKFPVKNYQKFTDCELLAQRELLVDAYINELMSLANQCMNLAKENMNSYDKKIQKIIDHVLQTEPTAKMSLLMKSIPELSKSGFSSSIDEDEQHQIKGVLDSLTGQVETLCELANNVNKNALSVCKDMDDYIYVGVTEEGKQNYLQILLKQKEYAKNHFDLAQKNYAMISAKQKLENNIYVEGVVYHCKNGYSKEDLSEIYSEPEPSARDSSLSIDALLNAIKQGNIDAVNEVLILISKKSKKEQTEIANKLISAMKELEQKQQKLSEQLSGLKEDKSQAQKLADLNKEMTDVSMSRKAVADMLRDTMQMQEELTETTKSVLDTRGRITNTISRDKVKEKPTLASKLKNFFRKIFPVFIIPDININQSEETEGPHCYSPAVTSGSEFCSNHQACAQDVCGPVTECVDNDTSITITLENGNTETFNHAQTGARYFCREDANGQKSAQYALPCSSPYHQFDGIMHRQCSPIGSYCARGSCGSITSCQQNGDTATITLSNGNTQSYRYYYCVGNELSRIAQCLNPFEQQGSYCGTNKFCADRICGSIANCEQVDADTVRITLETGQQQTYNGEYACVRSEGRLLIKESSECTSPFNQEEGVCGDRFRNGSYDPQFCAQGVCDFLTSCTQNDADSITVTTASGLTQSYNGYVCDDARGIRSLAPSQFSCSSIGMEQERNSDGAMIESTLCPRGQACAGNRCGNIATCVDNEDSITITLANGNIQTINHPESGARYFCRTDQNGQRYIQYSLPCSSPYHTYDGIINYQCSPIGSYCARGNCGAIASCVDGRNDATITLTTGDTQTYPWYRCSAEANGDPILVRRQ